MDSSDAREGTTVYLPIFHDGAYFYFGDGHALQGDGEICGSGLETTMDVTLQFDLIKGRRIRWPRMEDAEDIMVAGSARPLVDAFRIAQVELIEWLVSEYGFERLEAYQVVSQGGHSRIANVVDPNYTVMAKFPKKLAAGEKVGVIHMSVLSGKTGLIVGVANKRSIAWAIAQAAAAAGARLASPIRASGSRRTSASWRRRLADPLILPCDVTDDAQMASVFERHRPRVRRPRLSRARRGVRAARGAVARRSSQTSREGFRTALDISAYSLIALSRGRAAADGAPRRRQHPDADLSRQRARLPELQRDGRRQGRARVVGAVSRGRSRTDARSASTRFPPDRSRRWPRLASPGSPAILQTYRDRAPLRRTVETAEVADAALFLLGPAGRAVTAEVLMVDAGYPRDGHVA